MPLPQQAQRSQRRPEILVLGVVGGEEQPDGTAVLALRRLLGLTVGRAQVVDPRPAVG